MSQHDSFCDTIFINILTNMEFNFFEPEEVISILANQHGVKINTIEKRLNMKRTELRANLPARAVLRRSVIPD